MTQFTRRKLFTTAAAAATAASAFTPLMGQVAYVEKAGDGYREIPVAWDPNG